MWFLWKHDFEDVNILKCLIFNILIFESNVIFAPVYTTT